MHTVQKPLELLVKGPEIPLTTYGCISWHFPRFTHEKMERSCRPLKLFSLTVF